MKKTNAQLALTAIMVIFCMVVFTLSSSAQANTTVTGELVDMNCYMAHGAHGDDHKSCATACIKGGAPMAVLTSDGKLYLLVADHGKKDAYEEAKKYPGQQVTVSGALSEKDGIKGIVVAEVKAKS